MPQNKQICTFGKVLDGCHMWKLPKTLEEYQYQQWVTIILEIGAPCIMEQEQGGDGPKDQRAEVALMTASEAVDSFRDQF